MPVHPRMLRDLVDAAFDSDDFKGSSITSAPTPVESGAFDPAVNPVSTPPTEVPRI